MENEKSSSSEEVIVWEYWLVFWGFREIRKVSYREKKYFSLEGGWERGLDGVMCRSDFGKRLTCYRVSLLWLFRLIYSLCVERVLFFICGLIIILIFSNLEFCYLIYLFNINIIFVIVLLYIRF